MDAVDAVDVKLQIRRYLDAAAAPVGALLLTIIPGLLHASFQSKGQPTARLEIRCSVLRT